MATTETYTGTYVLPFEQPAVELEKQIDALESSFRAVLQVCTSGGDAATLRVFSTSQPRYLRRRYS